jgi:hypothetical protein
LAWFCLEPDFFALLLLGLFALVYFGEDDISLFSAGPATNLTAAATDTISAIIFVTSSVITTVFVSDIV